MRRILLLSVLLLGSTIIMNGKAIVKGNSTNDLTMVIGTYTGGGSKGIYTYRLDQNTGKAIPLSSASVSNPSYLIPSSNGKFIYAVSEMPDSTAALTAYALNKSNGHLKRINRQLTHGEDPCYVSTNGHEVLTANYTGGSMSVFPIRKDVAWGLWPSSFMDISVVRIPHVRTSHISIASGSAPMGNIYLLPISVQTRS